MRDDPVITSQLQQLGLSKNEVQIFLALLDGPKNPTEVSRLTGIARSNVYRIVDTLSEKGILQELTTENDKLLTAADPAALELLVIEQENHAALQRSHFEQLLPLLAHAANEKNELGIKTYRSTGGLKQMLWNELKHKEILLFSAGSLNQGTGKRWAEKYRSEIIRRNIMQRAIENPTSPLPTSSDYLEYHNHYLVRYVPSEILDIQSEISIHGDSVSIYNAWTHHLQLGAEIHNPFLAKLMRQVFENYWQMAQEQKC